MKAIPALSRNGKARSLLENLSRGGIVVLFLALILNAFAQDQLAPIDVKSTGGSLLKHVSSPVYQATEEDLQENSQLQDVLNKAPGVMFTQSGGIGGVGSIYLRGSESRHTLVLVDGMRLNDPANVNRGFDTAFFMNSFFQDLQLLRGPAPTLYGGDATGGVIELTPRRGQTPGQTVMSVTGGSFDTLQGFAMQDWRAGQHQGTFGVAHLQTRGFSRLNRKRHHATEPDGSLNTQFMQASRHEWNEKIATELLVFGMTGSADQDGSSVDEHHDRTKNQMANVVQTTRGLLQSGDWWLRTGVVSQKRDSETASQGSQIYRGETRQAQLGVHLTQKKAELIAGLQAEQEWQGSPGIQKQNDLGSAFTLGRLNFEKWMWEVGARGEHHQRYGGFLANESTVRYRPREELTLHAKAARGYKTPSLYQLYSPDSYGSKVGNSNLTPEKNVATEAGVEWKGAGLVSVVVFQQNFKDLIAYTNQGYANRGSLRVRGLETMVQSPEHSWGQVGITWTQLDFAHYSKTPLRRPPYLVTTTWTAYWGKWITELGLRAVGGRKDVDSNSNNSRLVAYETLSGSLKYLPNQREQWTLRLGNLTDRQYEDVWGYSVAPLTVSLQWLGRF